MSVALPQQQQPVPVCIEVLQVVDNCVQQSEHPGFCVALPAACLPLPVTPDLVDVVCTITSATCTFLGAVPVSGGVNATFQVTVTMNIELLNSTIPPPNTICTFTETTSWTQTVLLTQLPPNRQALRQCAVTDFQCGPCAVFLIDSTPSVCCEIDVCLEIQTKTPVKILVEASPCVPIECPLKVPSPLECPTTPYLPPLT